MFASPVAAQTGLIRFAYAYAHNNPLANVDVNGLTIAEGYSQHYKEAIEEAKKTEEGAKQIKDMEESAVIFKLVEGELEPGKFAESEITAKDDKGATKEVTVTVDFEGIKKEGPLVRTPTDVVAHEGTHANDQARLGKDFVRDESERRAYETTIDVRYDLMKNSATKDKYKGKDLLGPAGRRFRSDTYPPGTRTCR